MDLKYFLEKKYKQYKRKNSSADPVWLLHEFKDEKDIELIGLITAVYSYGSIELITRFVNKILLHVGPNVHEFTLNFSKSKDKKFLKGLDYRFHKHTDLEMMFTCLKKILCKSDSLKNSFLSKISGDDADVILPLGRFVDELTSDVKNPSQFFRHLLPNPSDGSACKRWFMYLRWMVRQDEIDLGLWKRAGKEKLIMPVDTHVYRVSRGLRLLDRKSCDLKFAKLLTERLKEFDSTDPVKYDFALCHIGVEKELIW